MGHQLGVPCTAQEPKLKLRCPSSIQVYFNWLTLLCGPELRVLLGRPVSSTLAAAVRHANGIPYVIQINRFVPSPHSSRVIQCAENQPFRMLSTVLKIEIAVSVCFHRNQHARTSVQTGVRKGGHLKSWRNAVVGFPYGKPLDDMRLVDMYVVIYICTLCISS